MTILDYIMIGVGVLLVSTAAGFAIGSVLRSRKYDESTPYKYPGQGGVDLGKDDDDRVRRVR